MKEQKYDEFSLLKSEYLSLMASTEYHLTMVITEYLGITEHSQEFQDWLISAPIPFTCKVDLFKTVVAEDTQLNQFQPLLRSLQSLWDYRNILAHSFDRGYGASTSRGRAVPENQLTLNTINSRIGQARKVEDLLNDMLVSFEQGTVPLISTDDLADGPM